MSKKEDIEFLKAYLKKLQRGYIALDHICKEDLIETDELPTTSPDAEHAARLADDNGVDGSLFRYIIPSDVQPIRQLRRRLEKQIKIIPRIIAKIEKAVETVRDETTEPTDLIDLAKALTLVYRSRSQIKRDIYDEKIKSYRKNPKGKHLVSLSEIQKVYLTK